MASLPGMEPPRGHPTLTSLNTTTPAADVNAVNQQVTQQQQQQQQLEQQQIPQPKQHQQEEGEQQQQAPPQDQLQQQQKEPQQQQDQGQQQPTVRVVLQNVTASFAMRIPIDPGSIANKAKNAEYNPKKLPACVMRIREPQATGLLFHSGKVVVTGASGIEAAREAGTKFAAVVESLGHKPSFWNFTVQNMVATAEVDYAINLELLAYSHARWCMFDPELFPGLVYQTARKGVVAHIFSSGRVVLTGAKQEEHLNDALVQLLPILNQFKQATSS